MYKFFVLTVASIRLVRENHASVKYEQSLTIEKYYSETANLLIKQNDIYLLFAYLYTSNTIHLL